MQNHETSAEELLDQVKLGDQAALATLFAAHEPALRRMVDFRLDPRLKGRVSPSDVLQETYLDALGRLRHFAEKPEMPFFVWLRLLANQRLVDVHRHHLGAQMRSVGQEVSLDRPGWAGASSMCLAAHLVGDFASPSSAFQQAELLERVEGAIEDLDPMDREVLALRHFEELSNSDVAQVLGIEKSAASKRYLRALERLKSSLAAVPGLLD